MVKNRNRKDIAPEETNELTQLQQKLYKEKLKRNKYEEKYNKLNNE